MTALMRIPIARATLALLLLAGALAGIGGVAPATVAAATPPIRCVTTSGGPPPGALASGCFGKYRSIGDAIDASASGDTIYLFADAGATAANPTPFSGPVSIATNLTLVGVGAVALDGGNAHTVVAVGGGATVTLIGLTIRNGFADAASLCGGNRCGGGIISAGTLALINTTVANNSAGYVSDAGIGGGIFNASGGTLTLIDSTVASNTAVKHLGGNASGGGIFNKGGTLTLIHATVAHNTAQGASSEGGGLDYSGTTTNTITNSIVAGNSASGGNDADVVATTTNSVLGGVTPNATTGLGTLGDYGGPTETVAITAASPAHDNAACATNPVTNNPVATDQRDLARPQGTTCDAGAFELSAGPAPPASPLSISTQSVPPVTAGTTYSQDLVSSGGTAPYRYTLLAGTLPTGITLGANGTFSGSTSQIGSFPITVGVADAGQFADIRALTLTVTPGPAAALTASPATPQSATVGTAFPTLSVTVKDANDNPVADGTQVAFTVAPADNGASATFANNGNATTANGVAAITATANAIAGGPYTVTATSNAHTATFALTNVGPCQPGSSSASGSTPCTPAPAGSYVATSGATGATPCPAGTFSATAGANACTPAPLGYYVAVAGATSATACVPGTYQDVAGQTSCKPAPAGSYVPLSGATAALPCPAGTSSAAGATACTISATSIGKLIDTVVTDPKVEATLKDQINAIASAPNANAKAGKLGAFINAVNAQTGKSITPANATILINLAKAL